MQIFTWQEIENALDNDMNHPFFKNGCGISIGSFDGLHKGHRVLLNTLVKKSKEMRILSGVVSFSRPLPSLKHSQDYQGDLTTLNQRLELFEKIGLDFVIIVDFTEKFSSLKGIDFLQMLIDGCNMQYIAEGIDFRCGYKGATDTSSIKYFAENNKIKYDFVDSVFYSTEGEDYRISSSFIRTMVKNGFFSIVEDLLERKFSLEVLLDKNDNILAEHMPLNKKDAFDIKIPAKDFFQVLPPQKIYHCNSVEGELRVEIISDGILIKFLDKKFENILQNKIYIEF